MKLNLMSVGMALVVIQVMIMGGQCQEQVDYCGHVNFLTGYQYKANEAKCLSSNGCCWVKRRNAGTGGYDHECVAKGADTPDQFCKWSSSVQTY